MVEASTLRILSSVGFRRNSGHFPPVVYGRRELGLVGRSIRRRFASLTVTEDAMLSDRLTSAVVAPQPPPTIALNSRHADFITFAVSAVALSTTCLFFTAIPTLLALKRAAESLEKLMDATREELPSTMAALRLSGMEISDLTMELSDISQGITQGVRSSANAVRLAEKRFREIAGINNNSPPVAMQQERMPKPTLAKTAGNLRAGIVKGRQVLQLVSFLATRYAKSLFNLF
ncbi:hypothetical protein M569_04387, partial [Genlisea aurea]